MHIHLHGGHCPEKPTGKDSQRRKPGLGQACSGLAAVLGLWAALRKPRTELSPELSPKVDPFPSGSLTES